MRREFNYKTFEFVLVVGFLYDGCERNYAVL
jgi:hypothetical protein